MDRIISKITYNYNSTIHSATKKSPIQLYYNILVYNTVLHKSRADFETESNILALCPVILMIMNCISKE